MASSALYGAKSKTVLSEFTAKLVGSKSTICTDWIRAEPGPQGELTLSHDFLGISLRVGAECARALRNSSLKLRVLNKPQFEPFLEEHEKRVYDIIQVQPKEFCFEPAAEAWLRLPSCVSPESSGQLVCLYSSNVWVRNGVRHLKWTAVDSECFQVNPVRTEAKLLLKKTGVYTLKLTPHLELTKHLSPFSAYDVTLTSQPKLHVTFPAGCVAEATDVTLKVLRIEELYNSPCVSPVPHTARARIAGSDWLASRAPSSKLAPDWPEPSTACAQLTPDWPERSSEAHVDITCSPVVLVRPTRCRFTRPVRLTLPLLGCDFDDLFSQGESRLVAIRSRVLNEEELKWKHHYSTPEIVLGAGGEQLVSFLLTRGGLYKVVRRLPEQMRRVAGSVSQHISTQLCRSVTSSYFVTTKLRGLMTEIAEPGKQFVLRIALFDASQTTNPDACFVSEVCSQPLTLPIGKTRFLVRGSFEPDRDAADHSEERTVMFTGKTTFVDFYMKLRLNDPTKLPEVIGKVSLHGERNTQYYISLCKPTPIQQQRLPSQAPSLKPALLSKRPRPLIKRQTIAVIRTPQLAVEEDTSDTSSTKDLSLKSRHSLPTLPETPDSSTRGSDATQGRMRTAGSAQRGYNRQSTWNSHVTCVSPTISDQEENWPTPTR